MRFRLLPLAAAGLLCASAAEPLAGQSVPAGTRIRVSGTDLLTPVIGSFQGVRQDSLVVLEDGDAAQIWAVQIGRVTRLEVSEGWRRGDRRRAVRWGVIGGLGGAALGYVVSAILQNGADETERYPKGINMALGAALGGGLGAFYGYSRTIEHWRSVPVPRRASTSAAPLGPAAVGVGFRR